MNGEDGDAIKEQLEKLKTSSMEIGKSIYSQNNNQSEGQSENQSENTQDGEEKKEEKKD
jgi:hypothetical protein